jgi:TolB-like protein/Tfp pilus assembly protein PilF
MKDHRSTRLKNIGRMLVVYLGGAWVFIEAVNFLIDKYGWDTAALDVIILTIIFGLPASIIYAWFNKKFTRGAIILLVLNGIIAVSVITINLIRPESMDPTQLQLLKSRDNQKKLAESVRALAILPFNNYTNNEEQAYLVSGLHDALIGEMGKVGALRVISRSTSSMYINPGKSLKEIAAELKVDAIIEGAVMGDENGIKIQLKLISAFPEEQQLWSKSYDIEMENILNLYSDVLKTIAREINITLSPQEQIRFDQSRPVNPEAYELYLKGRFNLAFLTPEGIKMAEEYFLKATEIDPQFAPAYGGLAGIWVSLKQLNHIPPELADPKMNEYLKKAFELDSTDAEVWRWYASKLGNTDYNWNACNMAMEKCLSLNPNFAEARAFYAHFLMIQNKWDEAWEQMNLAVDLDPFNPLIKGFKGILLMQSGRFDEFLSIFEPHNTSGLGSMGLSIVFSKTNQYDRAIVQLKKMILANKHEKVIETLDETYKRTDFITALKVTADALAEISDTTFVSPSLILQLYAMAGDREKTMYWIEKLYIRRDPNLPYWAIIGPLTKDYQNEPRYIEIMKRINLR